MEKERKNKGGKIRGKSYRKNRRGKDDEKEGKSKRLEDGEREGVRKRKKKLRKGIRII